MSQRSPLDYDVSVSAAKQRRTRSRGMSGAFESSTHRCDWPGCEAAGQYRAPRAPDRLGEFRWFCLDHVRRYNAQWDYFADVPEDELERMLRNANVWERPTWSLGEGRFSGRAAGAPGEGNAWERLGFRDPLEVLGENATINPDARAREAERPRRRLSRTEQMALDTLGVPHQVEERAEVRRAYRELVKELHPDMNAGESPAPERLARVLRAWDVLKDSPNFRD